MSFEDAVEKVLRAEGGYGDDPFDSGGKTKYGISAKQYPTLDIANLTRQEAIQIYRSDYWDACRCEDLPLAYRHIVFDSAVNQGVRTAIKLLQAALNRAGADIKVDGYIGGRTLAATAYTDPREVRVWLLALRAVRYAETSGFERFGLGWMRRLMELA